MSENPPRDRPSEAQEGGSASWHSNAEVLGHLRRLRQESERVAERFQETRTAITQTWERLMRSREGEALDRELRRAALNLLEDTELARLGEERQAVNRVRAEAAERASADRYRALFESMDEAFCIVELLFSGGAREGVDFRFLEVNPAFERHTGLANAAGRTMRELAPGHENFWFQIFAHIALTGEAARFENRAAALGRDFDVYAFRTGEPREHKVAVLLRDITQRKRHEESLRASAARQAFLVSLNDALRPLDDAAQIKMAAMQVLGKHLGVLRAQYWETVGSGDDYVESNGGYTDGAPLVLGRVRLDEFGAFIRESFRAGRILDIADVRADPRVGEAERAAYEALGLRAFLAVPLVKEGRFVAALAVHHAAPHPWPEEETAFAAETAERTWAAVERARAEEALRQSQERLQLVLDNAREYAIVFMDLERRIISWNDGARRILDYSEHEMAGQSADLIFVPEDRANHVPEQEAGTALRTGRASDERWHLRKDGSRFWGSGVMTAAHDATGAAIGLVKIFRDHTEERLAKQALEQSLAETQRARAAAEAAAQAKDHFLAVLSHELRTPLTPVMLAAGMIESACGQDPMIREMLDMIRRNIGIEARFIKDLLDVTRIGHGKFEITPAPTDLHQVIGRALEIVQPECDEKEQRLTVALNARQTMVSGDDARLEQVACNLLKNASKFTPEEGRIEVRTFNEDDWIVVEVADSGIGIDAADQALIFDAFAQANQSITQKFGGLGLGLAIAKAIVDGHGGELRVQSGGRGQGATFFVRMPLLS